MKKSLLHIFNAGLLISALALCSCDGLGLDGDDDDDQGGQVTGPETGQYEPAPEPGHTVITTTMPEAEFSDGRTYEQFASQIEEQYGKGVLQNLDLSGEGSWNMTIDPDAFLPGGYGENTGVSDPVNIPGGYDIPAEELVYTTNKKGDAVMLTMPVEYGEEILRDLLPADFDFVFDSDESGKFLERFNSGIFSVSSTTGNMSINFKYRADESGQNVLYIDGSMLSTTMNIVQEIIGYVPDEDRTPEIEDAEQYVKDYIAFLKSCEDFEVGTKMVIP